MDFLEFLERFWSPFFIATFKYMFSASTAIAYDLTFIQTAITISAGAITSFSAFFFSSSYFMERAAKARVKKAIEAEKTGNYIPKRKFTKTNKFIVKIKMHEYGFYWITALCPLFLSVPLGTIIVAKFYGGEKRAFLYGIGFLIFWSIPITTIWWLILK